MSEKIYTSRDAAKFLNVSPATLTNYAKHLEDNGYIIERNPKNHRCFVEGTEKLTFFMTV